MSVPAIDSRCLALIGGLGPGATVHYYREIVAALEKAGRTPRLLIAHADVGRVFSYAGAKDFAGLAAYLASFIETMAGGGAEFAAMVAVTPHICAPQLAARSPVPLIDMLTETEAVVRERGYRRLAVLGTRFSVESRLFGRLGDVEIALPQPGEIERIHAIYTRIVAGHVDLSEIDEMRTIAGRLIARDRTEAVLLAGTDLSPLFSEAHCDFPIVDCARVHIGAIARRMLG